MFKYTYYSIFIFVINNVIHRYKVVLSYSLFIKSGILSKIEKLIHKIIYAQLIVIIIKIKEINWYINAAILALE